MTQLTLAKDKASGRLSLEKGQVVKVAGKAKAVSRISIERRNKFRALAVMRKLKFITEAEKNASPKSTKLARSKAIVKKPVTKFKEFRLSSSKPRTCGRRAQIEDLYKTTEKARLASSRPKLLHLAKLRSEGRVKDSVCR